MKEIYPFQPFVQWRETNRRADKTAGVQLLLFNGFFGFFRFKRRRPSRHEDISSQDQERTNILIAIEIAIGIVIEENYRKSYPFKVKTDLD